MSKFNVSVLLTVFIFIFLNSCQTSVKKNQLSPEQQAEFIAKGKRITMLSAKALSGEVMKALQDGGVQHAVDYCHLQANPITDSISKVYEAEISRISDKFRNPANKPGELDLTVIEAYKKQLSEGQELQPHLELTSDQVIFYSPILLLNPACLQCHGEPASTMEQENYELIKSRYPEDLATGYKLGDLRGVWKIVY